jgi:hypothetical protein
MARMRTSQLGEDRRRAACDVLGSSAASAGHSRRKTQIRIRTQASERNHRHDSRPNPIPLQVHHDGWPAAGVLLWEVVVPACRRVPRHCRSMTPHAGNAAARCARSFRRWMAASACSSLRRGIVLVLASALLSGCNGLGVPQATTAVPSFRYELSLTSTRDPTTPVITVGEPLHYEWVPHADPNYATGTAEVTLCFALFGPWPDVATLKREFSSSPDAECPPPRATVVSESVRTTSSAGTRFKADAPGPANPGFYNLRQINIFRSGSTGGSMIFDRVVEARAR